MDVTCEQLDAYLNGDLSPADARCFEAHLNVCAACCEAIDEQGWIDGLLRSPERMALESPRTAIVGEIESAFAKSKQRARALVCGLAAAAAVFLAVGWILFAEDPELYDGDHTSVAQVQSTALEDVIETATDLRPRTIVTTGPESIAVPIESPYSDIVIVRIYPTFQAEVEVATIDSMSDDSYWHHDSQEGSL
jgi:anti-sigma factor RsiW